jgi:hypothetical protein
MALEPIWVNMVLKNVGQTVKKVWETGGLGDFDFVIVDEKGSAAPLTPLGKKLKSAPEVSWSNERELPPGAQMQNEHRLDKVWDMKRPGKYCITAIRPVSLDNWTDLKARGVPLKERFAYVTSNTVEIEVSGAKANAPK